MYYEVRKLPVYQHALEFGAALDLFLDTLPNNREYLKVQLRRAALSILLNLSEGATETEPREKARMYRLARRSAAECGAGLHFTGTILSRWSAPAAALDRRAADLSTEIHRLMRAHLDAASRKKANKNPN